MKFMRMILMQKKLSKSIKEPMTKFGDVWMLGEHMLLCGDSTKTESLNCLLGGGRC